MQVGRDFRTLAVADRSSTFSPSSDDNAFSPELLIFVPVKWSACNFLSARQVCDPRIRNRRRRERQGLKTG